MRIKPKYRPALEGLEQRCVPASIYVQGGILNVSNQTAALTIASTATSGQFKITDGGSSVTVNGVGTGILVKGTNLANSITVDTRLKSFGGYVVIDSGNGGDAVTLIGAIGGNLTVTSGNGDDAFNAGVAGGGNQAKVGGNFTYVGGLGSNDIVLNNNLQVGSYMQGTSVNDVTLGANFLAVGGNLTLSAAPSGSVPVNVTQTGATLSVGGAFQVTGNNGADKVNLAGTVTVNGSTTLNLGEGANVTTLNAAGGSYLGGNLSVNGGSGDDAVTFGANLLVGGNASLGLGEGANDVSGLNSAFTIAGNLSIVFGNGDNVAATISGLVSGYLSITQGNGTNGTLTINTVPAGKFIYRGGNGGGAVTDNIIVLNGAGTYSVDMVYGTGFAGLTIGATATLTGVVRGTGGVYTFLQLGNIDPNTWFINFP